MIKLIGNSVYNRKKWRLASNDGIFGIYHGDHIVCIQDFSVLKKDCEFLFEKNKKYQVYGTHYTGTISIWMVTRRNNSSIASEDIHFSIEKDNEFYFWKFFDTPKGIRRRKLQKIGI